MIFDMVFMLFRKTRKAVERSYGDFFFSQIYENEGNTSNLLPDVYLDVLGGLLSSFKEEEGHLEISQDETSGVEKEGT